jgi:hypothetical protein
MSCSLASRVAQQMGHMSEEKSHANSQIFTDPLMRSLFQPLAHKLNFHTPTLAHISALGA